MTESTKPISALRQRMIEDMAMRKLSPATQRGYVRSVKRFVHFFGRSPDQAEAEDLRRFQLHLAQSGVSSTTINGIISGLRFFYGVTLSRPEVLARVSHVPEAEKLPLILSMEEVTRLLAAATNLKHKAALSVAYGAGLRASEVVHLSSTDIDSERMLIRVEQGKGSRDRHAMLSENLLAGRPGQTEAAAPGLAVSGPRSGQPDVDTPAQPHLSHGPQGRRHR